jgi:hypothetical protein
MSLHLPIIYKVLSFKEKQQLQSNYGDNIKCLHKYYNWLMYRFSRKRFHPRDMKCMTMKCIVVSNEQRMFEPTNSLDPPRENLFKHPSLQMRDYWYQMRTTGTRRLVPDAHSQIYRYQTNIGIGTGRVKKWVSDKHINRYRTRAEIGTR